MNALSHEITLDQGHVQAHTSAQRFAMVSGVERHVSWQRCCKQGLRYVFSCLVGVCQKCQPNQQQHVYKPRGIKETARTWVQVKSLQMCPLQLGIRNN